MQWKHLSKFAQNQKQAGMKNTVNTSKLIPVWVMWWAT
jgi:hypothetical protein